MIAPLLLSALAAADPAATFLTTYCVSCHGDKAQMANRRFDRGPLSPADAAAVTRRVESATMPPRQARQPSAAERQAFLVHMAEQGPRKITLRRLNRREYLNTIGDLLQLDMDQFDPTSRFPRDQQYAHMDNIGETLVTSGYLLEQYLDAADAVLSKALPAKPAPAPRTWVFKDQFRQQKELDGARRANKLTQYMSLFEHPRTPHYEGAYAPLLDFAEGVPYDGFYEVKVQVEALHRKHPYQPNLPEIGMDPDAPFRFGVVAGNSRAGYLHHEQPIQPLLAETILEDGGPQWLTFKVRLDEGYQPRFTFPNGMNDVRRIFSLFPHRFPQFLPEDQRNLPKGIVPGRIAMMKYGPIPQIRIHHVEVRGPLDAPAIPASRRALYGDRPFAPERTREIIANFATRAYRRPATREEEDRLEAIAAKRRAAGIAPETALQDALKAVLCSPAFLYLDASGEKGRLGAYALASRLSYFLWSTMPDTGLLQQAASGALLKDEVLLAETRRMLASPRSKAFVEGFLDSWLNLRSLGDMPPERDQFGAYYWDDLQNSMKTETRMLMRHLLDENRSLHDFIDARYSFLNKPLARLYGVADAIPSADGHLFRKVVLNDPRRGGLLGHGSILTVSANGIETSPVTRGVWVLENILGTPPSPPPDDVPALDPDVRSAKTVRDLLSKHRENAACMSCHRSIDPPGFALENFDPIGRWRTKYPNGLPIDASGELPSGEKFSDIAGLRQVIAARKPEFTRFLTDRLLTYACGRKFDAADRPRIDAIAGAVAKKGNGLRDLVELIVLSDAFRHN
ncbi:MAG: DUF1592 domain-containing protein [Bryobacteraceae bacterium]|nr:DUF1592 domain-containing protein [Bryobacteraceae bacterium]